MLNKILFSLIAALLTNTSVKAMEDENKGQPQRLRVIYSKFPSETENHIFSLLHQGDLVRAGKICKSWHEALVKGPFRCLMLGPVAFPDILDHSSKFVHLNLRSRNFRLGEIENLVAANFFHLRTLNLSGNDLRLASLHLLDVPNLRTLELSKCSLEPVRIENLTLANLSNLTVLNLSDNDLQYTGVSKLASLNAPYLTTLDLGGNRIREEEQESLEQKRKSYPNLKIIY